jgi:hypothetical protein
VAIIIPVGNIGVSEMYVRALIGLRAGGEVLIELRLFQCCGILQ